MSDCSDPDESYEEDSDEYADTPIVIDNGSSLIKAGFAGDDCPRTVFPSVTGWPRHKGVMVGMGQPRNFVGDECWSKRGILAVKYPIEYGYVERWDDVEAIWRHTLQNELRVMAEEHFVMLTEPPLTPKVNREKKTQIMFESLNVPGLYVSNQAVLTLYSVGKTSGVVIQSGHSATQVVPIHEGINISNAVYTMKLGGRDVTNYLRELLNARGYNITQTSQEMEVVRDIKQKYGFVAVDYMKEPDIEEQYELPDGLFLTVGAEKFRSAEVMFKPDLIGLKCDGVPKVIYDSILKCDVDIQNELFENIIFAGGNSRFKGFEQRVLKELNGFVGREILVHGFIRMHYLNNKTKPIYNDIIDLMHRYTSFRPTICPLDYKQYSSWIGGSMLASLETFKDAYMTADEYNEFGTSLVHRKCL